MFGGHFRNYLHDAVILNVEEEPGPNEEGTHSHRTPHVAAPLGE